LKGKLRPVRAVAREVAEKPAAMANADGGALVIGIEDEGAISDLGYSGKGMKLLWEERIAR
jgi:predicted HTH transcriptional regulator